VAGLGLAALMLVPAILGYERYVITGDSMAGTYDRGSIVFGEAVPVSELGIGDVITYDPPPGGPEGMVTHRIVSIRDVERRGKAERVLRTAGDANAARDPWRFTLDGPTQARAQFAVPYVGYAFAAVAIREVRMAVIGGPALLIAILLLARLWREAGEEARREAGAPRSVPDGRAAAGPSRRYRR
jgi:signal peptidase